MESTIKPTEVNISIDDGFSSDTLFVAEDPTVEKYIQSENAKTALYISNTAALLIPAILAIPAYDYPELTDLPIIFTLLSIITVYRNCAVYDKNISQLNRSREVFLLALDYDIAERELRLNEVEQKSDTNASPEIEPSYNTNFSD